MVDRVARNRFAELLCQFIAGELTNVEYEEAAGRILKEAAREDRSLWAIYSRVWYFYDDIRTHHLRDKYALTDEGRQAVGRWIAFLHSDFEYEWPIGSFISLSGCLLRICTLGLAGLILNPIQERRLQRMGSWNLWPFFREADYESARARPQLPGGNPSTSIPPTTQ